MKKISIVLIIILAIATSNAFSQNVGQVGDTIRNYIDINGMKQGYWQVNYENGKPKYIGYFKNDKPIGKFTRFYPDGKIQSEAFFYDNSHYSSIKFYNQAQRVIAQGRYHDKLKDSTWTLYNDEGKLIKIENYKDGKLNGESKLFFLHSNDLFELTTYENGIKHGLYVQFYTENIPKIKARYCQGMRCDTTFIYHENGKIEYIIPYKDDVRHGVEQHFDQNGKLIESVPYENGRCTNPAIEQKRSKEIEDAINQKGRYPDLYQFDDPLDFLRKPLPKK